MIFVVNVPGIECASGENHEGLYLVNLTRLVVAVLFVCRYAGNKLRSQSSESDIRRKLTFMKGMEHTELLSIPMSLYKLHLEQFKAHSVN